MVYKKVPAEIEAVQWDGMNVDEVFHFLTEGKRLNEIIDVSKSYEDFHFEPYLKNNKIKHKIILGYGIDDIVEEGSYVVKNNFETKHPFYIISKGVFEMTYQKVEIDKLSEVDDLIEKLKQSYSKKEILEELRILDVEYMRDKIRLLSEISDGVDIVETRVGQIMICNCVDFLRDLKRKVEKS